jgi:pSer/pThr/pTyr-binding forkhead associated (FHA) protein
MAYAQQGVLKGNIDTKNFPEVSFMWNEYNPDTLSANQIIIKENGKEVKFTSQNFVVDCDSIPDKNKTILFLWEYQPTQKWFGFTAPLLMDFIINNVTDTTSTFNIVIFNQKQGPKLERFTSDKDDLITFISGLSDKNYAKQQNFQDNSSKSSLLSTIRNGLDLISKEPKDNTRAIVVMTSGRFIEGEKSFVINQSLKNKIPIYVIYYPRSKGENSALTQLVKDTYGQVILPDNSDKDAGQTTRNELLKIFNNLNCRHYGQDYKITFTSLSERNGSLSQIVVNESSPINYNVPDFSLFVWAKAHLILFLALLVLFLAGITFGVIFGIKFLKKKLSNIKEQKQEEERKKARQQAEQEMLKRKFNETQEVLKHQQKAAEQEKQQIQEQEQNERLAKQMRTKNLQPRILIINSSEKFNISNVTTSIGKNEDNDIVFSDGTVSKYHAQIVFNGMTFEIFDLQSTNGVIVNGEYIENAELKSGDIIQLGETVIKFYE